MFLHVRGKHHTHKHSCTYTHTHIQLTSICAQTLLYASLCDHLHHIHTYIHTYIHAYIHTYIINACVPEYIRMHTHTQNVMHRGVLKRFYMQPNAIIFIMVGLAVSRAIKWSNTMYQRNNAHANCNVSGLWKLSGVMQGPAEFAVLCICGAIAAFMVGANFRYVCVYVFMCDMMAAFMVVAKVRVYMHMLTYACLHVCMHTCMYVCIYIHTHTHSGPWIKDIIWQ